MYAQLIGRIAAEPHGAADTVPKLLGTRIKSSGTIGWDGKNGATANFEWFVG